MKNQRVQILTMKFYYSNCVTLIFMGSRSCDRMVVGFTTTYTYAISVYHHLSCEFESCS